MIHTNLKTPNPSSSPSSFRSNRILLYSGMTLALFIIVFVVLFALIQMRQMTDERTGLITENMAKLMEQTYDGLIDTIDVALLSSADEISRQLSTGKTNQQSITQYLAQQKARLPNVAFIRATNEQGDIIYGQGVLTPHVNSSDREHFILLKGNPNAGLFVSKPLLIRTDKKWAWLFARRINKQDGSFGGVVTAIIYVDEIDKLLSKITLHTGDVATLRDADIGVIARHVFNGNNPAPPGDKQIAKPFADALMANPYQGTYISGGTSIDSISRTQSFRRSEKYGYYVNVGISRDAELEVWHRQAWILAGLVAAFILVTLAFAQLINRAWLKQAKDIESLNEAEEIANLGHYSLDLKTGHWTSSTTLDRILGITRDYPRDAQHWQELVTPNLRQEIQNYLNKAIEQNLKVDREYCIIRQSDGSERWVRNKGIVVLNEQSTPFTLVGTMQDITEVKESERLFAESEVQYRSLISIIPEGVVLQDENSVIIAHNKRAERILGLSSEQMKGRDSLDPRWQSIHEDGSVFPGKTHPAVIALKTGLPQTDVIMGIHKPDGELTWISINAQPIFKEGQATPNQVVATIHDITERKQIMNELRASRETLHLFIENAPVGLAMFDRNMRYLAVSRQWLKNFALTGDIIGKSHYDVFPDIPDTWKEFHRRGLAGEVIRADEDSFERADGSVQWLRWEILPWNNSDNTIGGIIMFSEDITDRKAAEDEIERLAFYDSLTQLPNRRLLLDRLKQALVASSRSGRTGALLFLDLDNFKNLNDTLGHDIGDLLLQKVTERLKSCIREGDTVARLGGDEFVIMLLDLSEQAFEAATQAEATSEKILTALSQPYQLDTHFYRCSASIGVTLFSGNQLTPDELMKQADIAMYQAKKSGRNALRFFDKEMQESISARVSLEGELQTALESRQFHLYYQIQVDNSHQPLGAEALIRWIHPVRGLVSPAQFIPLAEETGLILPIGQWVLETACAQIKLWQQNTLTRELTLAVNVSARQFRQTDFVAQVQAAVQRHAINPKLLKLELTESLLQESIEDTIGIMDLLNSIGVQFSLDDFGTGYSSLQYIKRLPLDQLKIDQSFVRDIVTDSGDKAVVRAIIAMAQSLGLGIIAEGVETEEQRQILLKDGCTNFQGYLFGKPMQIDEFEALLRG